MMKKILVLFVALTLVSGMVFAQEEGGSGRAIEFFSWEFQVAYPVHWSNGQHDDSFYPYEAPSTGYVFPDKTVTANTAIGTTLNFNFTKSFGLVLDFDFSYMTKLTGLGLNDADSNSEFGFNIFLGPQFYVVNSDRLRVPLAIGVHMYYYADEIWLPYTPDPYGGMLDGAWANRTDMQFGLGVMFGVQFHFDNSIYLFSRTSVYIDLIRMHKIEGGGGTDGTNSYPNYERTCTDVFDAVYWTIKPAIGIGVKW